MEVSEDLGECVKFAGSQIAPIKCFLCDKNFMVGDESYLMFEKRLIENDEEDVSMAAVLSSAIGKEINESNAHSKVLCHCCNELVLEYELIEQRYVQLKYALREEYNKISKKYGVDDIVQFDVTEAEIDSVAETYDVIENNEDSSLKTELISLDKQDIFEYLLDKNFITVDSKAESKDDTMTIVKMENSYIEQIDGDNKYTNENLNTIEQKSNTEVSPEDVHFDEIVEQNQFSADENTLDDERDSNSLQYIAEENASIKSATELTYFELDLEKQKSATTEDARPSFLFDGEKFFCLLCPDVDIEKLLDSFDCKEITAHLKDKHNCILFVCYFCGGGFPSKSDLLEHVENTNCDLEKSEYKCDVCSKKFNNFRSYQLHMKIHPKSFSLKCRICQKQFLSKTHLDEHLNVHKGTRPFKCCVCSKDFATKYTLNSHMKIHYERERPYVCDKCNKSFLTVANLQQHSRTHSNIKEFVCDVCQKTFATQHNLEVHKIIHTGHKPFLCRTCGKSFARRAEITDHERTHTGEKPFKCDICGMKFAQRSNLSTHIKSTHFNQKKHKCDTCEKTFKRKRLLDYHVQAAHTGERPYKCEVCQSTFVYPEHYKKHLRIHSGVKPYSCEVCGKSFNSRDNRNAHRFIHSDKKPYECLTCGQGFMRKPLLYNHMQLVRHINDTIIVNQPRIKQTQQNSDADNSEIQIIQDDISNNYKMVMDTREMLMEDDEEIDELILEEEHLIDSVDSQNSINNSELDENSEIVCKQIFGDE